jgi:hypothetical protein
VRKREQTLNMVARPSQERHRKKRTVLGDSRGNAGMDKEGQPETALQLFTHRSGNYTGKTKLKKCNGNTYQVCTIKNTVLAAVIHSVFNSWLPVPTYT